MKQEPFHPEGALTLDREPEVEATITSLKHHFEAVRQHEVKRLRGRLGQLTSMQENALESLTHGIIDQILYSPTTALKAASENHNLVAVIEIVKRLFGLSVYSGSGRTV